MPNRPNFPIPDDIHPPMQCIQLCIPNEPTYKSVFAGLIYELTYWYNWQRTDDDSGAQCANVWKEIYNSIDWSTMSCCCPEPTPFIIRITAEGVYQTSTDGGTTWEDAPAQDPRKSQPYYPPFLPDGTIDDKCTYADSVVQLMKTQLVDLLETDMTYAQVLAIIATIFTTLMGALAPTVIGSIIVGIIGAVIVGIIQVGIPAFQAAMTSDVYNRFKCNLFAHMQSDGSFTQSDIDAIYAQVGTDETGLAMLFLQGFVAAAGTVGLTNAARLGAGAPDADCLSCECDDTCADFFSVYFGSEISSTGCNIQASSALDGSHATIGLDAAPNGCRFTGFAVLTGTVSLSWQWYLSDGSGPFTHPFTPPLGANIQTLTAIGFDSTTWTGSFDFETI
jgi:hypothetical protein